MIRIKTLFYISTSYIVLVRNKIIPQSKFVKKVLFCVAFRIKTFVEYKICSGGLQDFHYHFKGVLCHFRKYAKSLKIYIDMKWQRVSHCSNHVVQTNLPNITKTYIFRTTMKSTFTWTMPYKSISGLLIT